MADHLKVEIVSKEMIKPTSTIPQHPEIHQLSLVDQLVPPIYFPLLFFYSSNSHNLPSHQTITNDLMTNISQLLKQSLSKTLSYFYPLAGTIDHGDKYSTVIHCNDQGAEFVEARVTNYRLSDFLKNQEVNHLMSGLLPFELISTNKTVVLGVQLNEFVCGGIAIGVCIAHKVADGTSGVGFMNTWATIARGHHLRSENSIVLPNFQSAAQAFPPRDDFSGIELPPRPNNSNEKIVARRLVFEEEMLKILKEKSIKGAAATEASKRPKISDASPPSRVEVVSAFIWENLMDKTTTHEHHDLHHSSKISLAAFHLVNLRNRMDPPLPDQAFGNLCWFTVTSLPAIQDEGVMKYQDLVGQLRNAIKKVDHKYITRTLNNAGDKKKENPTNDTSAAHTPSPESICRFSSWCGFPVYDVDFGCGKPIWYGFPALPFKNMTVLVHTRTGNGIEALVNATEESIATLQQNYDLLSIEASRASVDSKF